MRTGDTRIEIVSDGDGLCRLGDAWNTLWQHSQASVFQAHCWITAWWRECHHDHRLRIVCAWQGDMLIGVLPLCVRRWHGLRVLEWAAQPYSDYCDALLLHADPAVLRQMWAAVSAYGGFDLARLKHVRPNALAKCFLGREERTEVCLQVASTWPDGAAWFKTFNKKTRNNYHRAKRILGEATIRQLYPGEAYAPVIERLLMLKRRWQKNRDSPLVRSDTVLLALADALAQLGSLRIFLIEQDGVVIAGSVNAVHGDRMLALFATYDPAYERASPGILLMTDYTKWAFDNAITEVDYLLGAEPYKFKFANQQVRLHIFVAARTMIGRVALTLYLITRRLKTAEPPIDIGSAYRTENGTPRVMPDGAVGVPEKDSRSRPKPAPKQPASVPHALPGASRRQR